MKVWGAFYNGMIHESSYALISLHYTKKGAEMAVEWHKKEMQDEHNRLWEGEKPEDIPPFDQFQDWMIRELTINE